ncbi:MAG TPA: hypothetical protein PKA13_20235 [Geminicoccaceae bacterium]|nr:hypothetical protein [Geminicoccus sp.]HMU52117.1 hypothetical protein [Geminicoccaceae bacterium]
MTNAAADGRSERDLPSLWQCRFALAHGIRWLILLVLYVVILSWIVAMLGAWQFQDRLRASGQTAAGAYALRMDLLKAAAGLDASVQQLVRQMRDLTVSEQAGGDEARDAPTGTQVAGTAFASSTPTPEELRKEIERLTPFHDRAVALRAAAVKYAHDYRLGFGLAGTDEAGRPEPLPPERGALLADVVSAQTMELGLLRRTWLLSFAEPPMQRLVTWPEGHLTIVLTLLMGMLGSTLYTTRFMLDYAIKGYRLSEPAPYPTSWFVFRPLFGAATALAIYVLFRAGQLVLTTEPAAGGDSAVLNPFVIAFMAIIAGLMSWQALEFIETSGERWLRGQARDPLWASGLARQLQALGRPASALAVEIGRTPRQVERWIRFRDMVPPEMQDRIAAALDARREQLFGKEAPPMSGVASFGLARDLAAAVAAAGLTQEQLAMHLGTDMTMMADWIARSRALSPAQQERVADLLDVPVADLFEPVPAPSTLAVAMEAKGVSVQQIVENLAASGVGEAEVQAWRDGLAAVPRRHWTPIAAALGVDVDEIAWG